MDPLLRTYFTERAYPTMYANSTLLLSLLASLSVQKHSPYTRKDFEKEYDYIVVGAGAAGSVVASRLSEMYCATVLLLEAGGPPPLLSDLPGPAQQFIGTEFDWQYVTEPLQYTGTAFIGNRTKYPRGKALGGTTILNTMQYVRGNHKNYDEWAAGGATGWSFNETLKYFKKLEENVDDWYLQNGYHGYDGPLTVSEVRYEGEIKQPLVNAFQEVYGYEVVDPNGPTQTGIYTIQASYRKGQRCSTAKAYLVPADMRKNLHIVTNALVKQVVIENRQATGVLVDFKGESRSVRARREVIVSGGALNTPQILMLSGIGPAEDLEKLGIPVIADLPVGKMLQDKTVTFQAFELNDKIEPFNAKLVNTNNIEQYIRSKSGPLASTGGRAIDAFINGKSPRPYPDFPRIAMYFTESYAEAIKIEFNLNDEVYDQVFKPYEGKPLYTCQVQNIQPKSRGYVKLRSKNPYDPPMIYPGYLSDPEDFEHHIEGMKMCNAIGTSDSMKKVGSRPSRAVTPGCEDFVANEDLYLRCIVRSPGSASHQPVGTARMGGEDDPDTVVTPELKVKTIDGMRVVDGSIMPKITSGNTEVPIIMIAEKASDMIKESHGSCS